jgi:Family of unknown function (DUF6498)
MILPNSLLLLRPSTITLFISNLIPVVGVVFLGWTLQSVLYLYLFESMIIGFYSALHLWFVPLARNSTYAPNSVSVFKASFGRLLYITFFCVMFGILIVANATFLHLFFPLYTADLTAILPGIISMFISHGISYNSNFLNKKEYQYMTVRELFARPFKRVFFPHILFFLALLPFSAAFGSGGPVVLFILLRTLIDMKVHFWEHGSIWLMEVPGLRGVSN